MCSELVAFALSVSYHYRWIDHLRNPLAIWWTHLQPISLLSKGIDRRMDFRWRSWKKQLLTVEWAHRAHSGLTEWGQNQWELQIVWLMKKKRSVHLEQWKEHGRLHMTGSTRSQRSQQQTSRDRNDRIIGRGVRQGCLKVEAMEDVEDWFRLEDSG